MSPWLPAYGVALLALGSLACRNVDCATAPGPLLRIEVVDRATAAPRAAGALGLVLVGDSAIDSLHAESDDPSERYLYWQDGPPGAYDVRVEHAGYEPWTQAMVDVGRSTSACGAGGMQELRAELTALSAP